MKSPIVVVLAIENRLCELVLDLLLLDITSDLILSLLFFINLELIV